MSCVIRHNLDVVSVTNYYSSHLDSTGPVLCYTRNLLLSTRSNHSSCGTALCGKLEIFLNLNFRQMSKKIINFSLCLFSFNGRKQGLIETE